MPTSERNFTGDPASIFKEARQVLAMRRDFYVTQEVSGSSLFAMGRKAPSTTILLGVGVIAIILFFFSTLISIVFFIILGTLYASSPNNSIYIHIVPGDHGSKVSFTVVGKEAVNLAKYLAGKLEATSANAAEEVAEESDEKEEKSE